MKMSAYTYTIYIVYGVFLAFFTVAFIKAIRTGKSLEIAAILLTCGLLFFFLFSNPRLLFKMAILEFFILGVIVATENKKAKSYLPFVILLGVACLVEIATNLFSGSRFYYLDVWMHSLSGLSGFIAGLLIL